MQSLDYHEMSSISTGDKSANFPFIRDQPAAIIGQSLGVVQYEYLTSM